MSFALAIRRAARLLVTLLPACAGEADVDPEDGSLAVAELGEFDLSPRADPARAAPLAWHTPAACPQVYRVRVDETYPPGLAERLHTQAEHSESFFVVSQPREGERVTWPPGPVPKDRVFTGRLTFQGPRTQDRPVLRDFALSAELAGPAAPDAACMERSWDPVEDTLALGWPRLPARLVARGETWRGARVEARCNRSACVDPQTGGGGADNHFRPCATMSWRERLDGIYTIGDEHVAQVSSFWSDGHPLGETLASERIAVISVEHGRLLHSQTFVHHGYSGIEREVRVDAVDACPGSLVAAGWTPGPAIIAARDALVAAAMAPPTDRDPARKQTPERGR
jgi:hypothetical protein